MEINFNGNATINNSSIGNNNAVYNTAYNNESLTDNDWKSIENIFDQKLKELGNDSDLRYFFSESKKLASTKDKKGLKYHFKNDCTDFIKNVLYNMASTGIITLLSKIGILI